MVAVAPERRIVEDGIHAEMMPTANPDDDLAMHNRRDPYWDRLWAPGSQANWMTGAIARYEKAEGINAGNAKLNLDPEEAMRILTGNRGRLDRLAGALQERAHALGEGAIRADAAVVGALSTGQLDLRRLEINAKHAAAGGFE